MTTTKSTAILLTLTILTNLASMTAAHAADYTTMNLPDGAIARLGKGKSTDVKFSPDGKTLAVATSTGIWFYDVRTHAEIALMTGHSDWVHSVAFSPDGSTLASASWDNTVKLWEVSGKREIATLTGHSDWVYSVAFSPDGNTLASASRDNTVKLWEVSGKREIATLTGHSDWVHSVAFSLDGKTLASGSWDGTVLLWELSYFGIGIDTTPP